VLRAGDDELTRQVERRRLAYGSQKFAVVVGG